MFHIRPCHWSDTARYSLSVHTSSNLSLQPPLLFLFKKKKSVLRIFYTKSTPSMSLKLVLLHFHRVNTIHWLRGERSPACPTLPRPLPVACGQRGTAGHVCSEPADSPPSMAQARPSVCHSLLLPPYNLIFFSFIYFYQGIIALQNSHNLSASQ